MASTTGTINDENGALSIDGVPLHDANVIGDTLVLNLQGGETVNIPLTTSGQVDFCSLTTFQIDCLSTALRGALICDSAGTPRGYLMKL